MAIGPISYSSFYKKRFYTLNKDNTSLEKWISVGSPSGNVGIPGPVFALPENRITTINGDVLTTINVEYIVQI